MKKKSNYFTIKNMLWLLLLIGAGFFIKSFFFPTPEQPSYITAVVARSDISKTVLADGTINAYKQVSVGAQVSGQIKKLYVELGQEVKKDDPIADIDDLTRQNELKQQDASLKALEAQRTAKEANLVNYQLNYDRQLKLIKQAAGTQSDLDDAKTKLDVIKADIKELEANIIKAQIAVDTAKLNLGYTKILSPIDGVVVAIPVEEGQTVNAVQSAPTIVKVAQLDKMTVEAQISEADVISVKKDMPVYFTILGKPNYRYDGLKLRAIEPAPQSINNDNTTSSSGTTAVFYNGLFDVENTDGDLRISMTAQVYIVLAESKNTLTIPTMAIQRSPKGNEGIVYIIDKENNIEEKSVTLGVSNNVSTEILTGLTEGETVIVSGTLAGKTSSPSTMRMRF